MQQPERDVGCPAVESRSRIAVESLSNTVVTTALAAGRACRAVVGTSESE